MRFCWLSGVAGADVKIPCVSCCCISAVVPSSSSRDDTLFSRYLLCAALRCGLTLLVGVAGTGVVLLVLRICGCGCIKAICSLIC